MNCTQGTVLPLLIALALLTGAAIYEGIQGFRLRRVNRALENAVKIMNDINEDLKL